MANGAFKFKDNSGNVVSFISGSGSNISFSGGTLDLSGMTGLTLGNLTLSGTTQNALSASHAASYLLTSSFNTYSGTTDTVIGTLQTSTGSLNSFTSSATTRLNSIEGVSGSYATTGSNLFKGNQTISGSIIPAVDNAYDLGSVTHQFRDLYLSSASLYIDGTKVLGSTAQELQITTDTGQSFKILEAGSDNITLQSADGNIELKSSGGGDVILDPTTGVIALKGTTTLYAGNKILSSDGNAIQIGNSATITGSLIVTGFIETQELRTTYISSSILYRSGSTKFGDELSDTHSFTGSLLVSGTISVPDSNLVSGSSQILNGSGVWSGSAQLPSGVVSGSAQVDVMSTTNIARLATTGSNTFVGNQIVSGSFRVSGSIESSFDNLGTEGGQLILRGPVNRYNVDNWSGNALRIFREDDATAANGNVIIFASGSGQVGINKNSTNATLDVNGNALVSGSLTTTGNVNVNSDGIVINRSTSGEPYLFFRKDGVNRGSIYGADNTSGFRFFVGDSNLTLTLTSGSATITGNLTTTGTINGLSLPNDLFAQQFLLMGS
jgi:hypothetical protein